MGLPIIGDIIKLVGGVIDKVLPDKMSDVEKAKVKLDVALAIQDSEDKFFAFTLEHSGAAKDMPRSIQILRGTVRPVLTYASFALLCFTIYYYFFGTFEATGPDPELALKLVSGLNGLTLGFWFYSKNKERTTNFLELFSKKDK